MEERPILKGRCSATVVQKVRAAASAVWSVLRDFENPQTYKPFVKNCFLKDDGKIRSRGRVSAGCERVVELVSGLPASSSVERLDVIDDENFVFGFSIIGGEHRLRNYRSVTTLREEETELDIMYTLVMETYAVDVPEGNTEEETKLFVETIIGCNLRSLASLCERSRPCHGFCLDSLPNL